VNYLLDTHAFLWWIGGDARFSAPARRILEDPKHTIFFSVASIWEIVLKFKLGKLRLPEPLNDYLLRQIQNNRIELLTIHANHVFGMLPLPMHHRDPFDRLLIAQAQTEDMVLVSNDPQLTSYAVRVLW